MIIPGNDRSHWSMTWLTAMVLILIGVAVGGQWAWDRAKASTREALATSALWEAQARLDESALTMLQGKYQAQVRELHRVQGIATTAVAERNELKASLQKEQDQRKADLLRTAESDADCATLATALCPSFARQLFGG